MSLKFKVLAENIFAVEGDTSREVAELFLRFQEHYESPEFRGKVFSLKEFKDWYKISRGQKRFTYYTDWSGFNVPGYVFLPFFLGKFKRLAPAEKWLLDRIKEHQKDIYDPFYVLGYQQGDALTTKHEMAHALFYADPYYRGKVKEILSTIPTGDIMKALSKDGYHDDVLQDECHAYILTEYEYLRERGLWNNSNIARASAELNALYERCANE